MPSASSVVLRPCESSDAVLLTDSGRGDTEAFGVLYDRHAARALALARSICLDRHRSERAVEHGFLVLAGGTPVRHAGVEPLVWLLVLVGRRAVGEAVASGQAYRPFPGLARDQAEALALVRFGGLDHSQVADGLGVSPERVKHLLRDALHVLGSRGAPAAPR